MKNSADPEGVLSTSAFGHGGDKSSVQVCRYTPSTRCHPSSCLRADFRQYFAVKRLKCFSDCSAILFSLPKQLSLVPTFDVIGSV